MNFFAAVPEMKTVVNASLRSSGKSLRLIITEKRSAVNSFDVKYELRHAIATGSIFTESPTSS